MDETRLKTSYVNQSKLCFALCRFSDFIRMVVMNSRGGDQEEFKVDTVSESESNVDVESRNFFMVLNIEIV